MSILDTVQGMKLGAYLKRHGISFADFATRIGVSNASVVSRFVAGRVPQDKDVMAAIVRETSGEVTPNDWYSLDEEDDGSPVDEPALVAAE